MTGGPFDGMLTRWESREAARHGVHVVIGAPSCHVLRAATCTAMPNPLPTCRRPPAAATRTCRLAAPGAHGSSSWQQRCAVPDTLPAASRWCR